MAALRSKKRAAIATEADAIADAEVAGAAMQNSLMHRHKLSKQEKALRKEFSKAADFL